MFNWFKGRTRTIDNTSLISNAVDRVMNAATMTWANVWGTINHEQMFSSSTANALKLSAVKCALEIYTGMVADVPRRMYAIESGTQEKTKVVSTTDHPASRMFSHYFNPELCADDALLSIIYDVLMDGNCYFLREFDSQNRTSRGYYIHPSRIPKGNIKRAMGGEKTTQGRPAVKGELLYYVETGLTTRDINSEPLLIPRSDIIHFKGKVLDTENHRGQGFISNSTRSLDMYRASEEFGWKFYSRGIATQMFLTTENRLAPEVLTRLQANFEEDPDAPLEDIFKHRILEQGLKPVNMGIPFQQLQFIETRAFSVEDVARGLNIPPSLLHSYMGTEAGGTDLSQAIAMFVQTGIGPLLTRIANQFRTELLPLPSQMLFGFEFERLYLYRSVIDKFTQSLRNLFEIGIINRKDAASLLGFHIDPQDEAADPRYVPVNLMTVEHSLLLEDGAELANEATKATTESTQKANAGLVDPATIKPETGSTDPNNVQKGDAKPPSGKMDESPSKSNIDKRIRNAFDNVVKGLCQYEKRVLDQKKQTRAADFDTAVSEFYAVDGKFHNMLKEQLESWNDLIDDCEGNDVTNLINNWITNKLCPEGIIDDSGTKS
jgi:HK97 family phage portal protein